MTGWTDLVGWTLVHFVWQATIIALAAAVLLRVFARAAAQLRYVVACAALALTMMAPVVTAITVAVPVPVETVQSRVPSVSATEPARQNTARSGPMQRVAPGIVALRTASAAANAHRIDRMLPLIVALWVAGVFVLTCRLAIGWWRVSELRSEAFAHAASRWSAAAERLANRLGVTRAIRVVDTDSVDTPTVIGWLRPVVLLPIAALAHLSPDQVDAILAHELAHVRRHDFAVNLLQTIAETLLFYHPAVWWLSARIRVEREHCCDDIAVGVCGDPVAYAEALTELASWVTVPQQRIAVAATDGSLLSRVRRLLQTHGGDDRRHVKVPMVMTTTLIVVLAVGARLLVAAQVSDRKTAHDDGALVPPPQALNDLVGFSLVPPMPHYVTDDPRRARAWDVKVTFPGGEMPFIGFTGRSVIRYAFVIDSLPLLDGPGWLDSESLTLHATTPSPHPSESDVRLALRIALEQQFGVIVNRVVRDVPAYGLVTADPSGRLGPDIHPSTADCLDGNRVRPPYSEPRLVARGERTLVCGIDDGFFGPTGYRVTLAEFARSLRHLPIDSASDREVVDQTGLTGTFDFVLHPGPLPLAAIATAHPDILRQLRRLGVLTFPEAIERQLGLQLVPMDLPREVATIAAARRPAL